MNYGTLPGCLRICVEAGRNLVANKKRSLAIMASLACGVVAMFLAFILDLVNPQGQNIHPLFKITKREVKIHWFHYHLARWHKREQTEANESRTEQS